MCTEMIDLRWRGEAASFERLQLPQAPADPKLMPMINGAVHNATFDQDLFWCSIDN